MSDHAELFVSIGFLVIVAIWACFIPRPGQVYVDADLKHRAEDTKNPDQASFRADSIVWNLYEEDFTRYKWGVDVNQFLYSSLKTLAILLSAVTPALIVAPSLRDKKVLAALPAVIVAVATGLIGEFDFKEEGRRFDAAVTLLQTEKLMFVTQGGPFYSNSSSKCMPKSTVAKASAQVDCVQNVDLMLVVDPSDAPYLPPSSPVEARANFAYRIEKIRQAVSTQRDQFLLGRGQQVSSTERKTTPGGQPPASTTLKPARKAPPH